MDGPQAVNALGAIAHEHRLAIYRLLVEQGPGGIAAGRIAQRFDMPPSTLTFHLQQLLHARLATQRRAGRQVIYAADFATMNDLVAYLTENCCGTGATCDTACAPSPPRAAQTRRARSAS